MDSLFSSVQLLSCVWFFVIPWTAEHQNLCPSPTSGACSNSCPLSQWCHSTISSSVIPFFHLQSFPASGSFPLSQWCHPTISSSVIPFSSCLQSFPASGSFPTSQFLASGGQSIGALASASVLPMNIQDWFPLGLTGLISLQSKELKSLLQHHSSKASILWHSAFFMV